MFKEGSEDRGRQPDSGGFGHRGRRHGRHGLHSGRKLSSGDLQLLLLSLLERGKAHGYELMKSLEGLSDGFYVPSPGMIYPSLTYLVEIGQADVEVEGNRKRYRLTDEGRTHLEGKRSHAQLILDDLAQIGTRMEDARRALAGERDFGEGQTRQSDALREARFELKDFLRGYQPPTPQEDARVVSVLRSAIANLRGEPTAALTPEALLTLAKARRSMGLSRLKPDPVPRDLIERMLEAANWAPSHEDTEPWRFSVFTGEGRARLAEIFQAAQAADGKGPEAEGARKRAFAAPVWISLGLSPKLKEDGSLLMSPDEELMAVACAVQNLHLMAQAQGLAGMWHSKGLSIHPTVARELGLAPPSRLLGFFMCGWPATDWLTSARGPIEEKVVWFESEGPRS